MAQHLILLSPTACSIGSVVYACTVALYPNSYLCISRSNYVDLVLQDLLAHLRPSLQRLSEYEQAAQAVAAIEASEARSAASLSAGLGAIEEEESDSDDSQDNSGSDSDAEGELPYCHDTMLLLSIQKHPWRF